MKKSNVVILTVNMVTGDKLHEISVASFQERAGNYYHKLISNGLSDHWAWMGAARFMPEVQADGQYTAIKFEV